MQVHIPRGHQDVRSKHRHNLILDVHPEVRFRQARNFLIVHILTSTV